jgi:hypothetical protein
MAALRTATLVRGGPGGVSEVWYTVEAVRSTWEALADLVRSPRWSEKILGALIGLPVLYVVGGVLLPFFLMEAVVRTLGLVDAGGRRVLRDLEREGRGLEERDRNSGRPRPPGETPKQASFRCAFCHDDVPGHSPHHRCLGCQTVLHLECRSEAGACPTLGCEGRSPSGLRA